jgi:hypothetical protein
MDVGTEHGAFDTLEVRYVTLQLAFGGLEAEQALYALVESDTEFHSFTPVDRYLGEHRRIFQYITRRVEFHREDELDLARMYTSTWTECEYDSETLSLFHVSEFTDVHSQKHSQKPSQKPRRRSLDRLRINE